MKILVSILFLSFAFFYYGCSDNSGGSTTTDPFGGGPIGGGGGGTGNVTFQVSTEQGDQGIFFRFKPSTNVTAAQITVRLPAQQFEDVVNNPNPDQVFTPTEGFSVGESVGVERGQQWTFVIQGKVGSAQGQQYNVTTNFTIP